MVDLTDVPKEIGTDNQTGKLKEIVSDCSTGKRMGAVTACLTDKSMGATRVRKMAIQMVSELTFHLA